MTLRKTSGWASKQLYPNKPLNIKGAHLLDLDKLFQLATPILEKNDFGVSHTQRVYNIAKEYFPVAPPLDELTYASIILHDIGGCTIKDQYEKGPAIATQLLKQLECRDSFIRQVCNIIATHHDHPDNPSTAFQTLYDADKLVNANTPRIPTLQRKRRLRLEQNRRPYLLRKRTRNS